jgi:hypothetical protein
MDEFDTYLSQHEGVFLYFASDIADGVQRSVPPDILQSSIQIMCTRDTMLQPNGCTTVMQRASEIEWNEADEAERVWSTQFPLGPDEEMVDDYDTVITFMDLADAVELAEEEGLGFQSISITGLFRNLTRANAGMYLHASGGTDVLQLSPADIATYYENSFTSQQSYELHKLVTELATIEDFEWVHSADGLARPTLQLKYDDSLGFQTEKYHQQLSRFVNRIAPGIHTECVQSRDFGR